jgi:putative membrane protein
MLTTMWVAAAIAGLVHVLFFCMESLWWTKPAVYRRFRSTEAEALVTRSLAFNQGFYNLFLAAGALGGLVLVATGHGGAGMILAAWSCASMLAAAVVLAASSPQMLRGAAVQGLPPLVFLAVAAYVRWS